jgi:hypothetical protein
MEIAAIRFIISTRFRIRPHLTAAGTAFVAKAAWKTPISKTGWLMPIAPGVEAKLIAASAAGWKVARVSALFS